MKFDSTTVREVSQDKIDIFVDNNFVYFDAKQDLYVLNPSFSDMFGALKTKTPAK